LPDTEGRIRRLTDYRGHVVAVFFGYTHCPDACPTTLGALRTALRQLGARADQVDVILITVDPERDTPQLLRDYVAAFGPRFSALRGSPEQTAATAARFRVVIQKQPGSDGNYSVDHTAGTYLYDPKGRVRLFVNYGQSPEVFAHDIGLLLGAS
jgi:protein SCO1